MHPAILSNCHVTEREAADFLGVSVKTVQAWRARGGGPKFAKFGRAVRYPLNELKRWAEEQMRCSTADQGASA